MHFTRTIRYAYLAYFSKPAADRKLFRALRNTPIRSFVELGLSDAPRTLRLLDFLRRYHSNIEVRYTAIDLFEARPSQGLSLKAAHQLLGPVVKNSRLIPGDPYSALSRSANSLLGTDLLIVHADQDRDSLERAWFFVPRMLQPHSLVFVEEPGVGQSETCYRQLGIAEVASLATASRSSRRAA